MTHFLRLESKQTEQVQQHWTRARFYFKIIDWTVRQDIIRIPKVCRGLWDGITKRGNNYLNRQNLELNLWPEIQVYKPKSDSDGITPMTMGSDG